MQPSLKKVSIVIVNWNGKHWLEGCLPTLAKVKYSNVEWIIVDNASTDGSVEWVKKHYPQTKIIVNEKNLGFSHANNIGYKVAHGKYVLFLNNDTLVMPDFLGEFVKVFENDPTVGGAQSKILLMDDHSCLDTVGAYLTPTGFLYHNGFRQKDSPKFDRDTDLYTAKGACMMFRMNVLKAVEVDGWIFDPDYFAYFEETDLCHRVWLLGYRIVYAYRSVIYHKMGATSGMMDNAFIQYHSFKNRINSYLKNLGFPFLFLIIPLHLFLCACLFLVATVTNKRNYMQSVVNAVVWNIRVLPESFRKRRYIQTRIRRSSDSRWIGRILRYPSVGYYLHLFA